MNDCIKFQIEYNEMVEFLKEIFYNKFTYIIEGYGENNNNLSFILKDGSIVGYNIQGSLEVFVHIRDLYGKAVNPNLYYTLSYNIFFNDVTQKSESIGTIEDLYEMLSTEYLLERYDNNNIVFFSLEKSKEIIKVI